MTKIPVTVTSFMELVEWLADEHHDGVYFKMAEALNVSPSVVYQWKRNMIHRPSEASIKKMALYYDLDEAAIILLTYRPARPISGGSDNAREGKKEDYVKSVRCIPLHRVGLVCPAYYYPLAA